MIKHTTTTLAALLLSAAILLMLSASPPGLAATPTATPVAAWSGRVLAVVPDLSLSSTVLRVKVEGRSGQLVTVAWADYSTTTLTGLKPELESDVAEFAPVPAGPCTVSVPELGVSLTLSVDGHSYVVVEFTPEPPPTATPTGTPAPSPSATPSLWQGRVVTSTTEKGVAGSVLRVTVEGRTAWPVVVTNRQGWSTTSWTGVKPELGPYTAEFAPVPTGTITIEPGSLGASLTIELAGQHYVYVEFTPVEHMPTATPSATLRASPTRTPRPTASRTPTLTPAPSRTPTPTATPSPTPSDTPTPTPTPTPLLSWSGRVVTSIEGVSESGSTLRVSVARRPGLPVVVASTSGHVIVGRTNHRPEYGVYQAEFPGLAKGTYLVVPLGLGTSLLVHADGQSYVVAEFTAEELSTPTASPTMPPAATATPTPTHRPVSTPLPVATPTATASPTPTPRPTAVAQAIWFGRVVQHVHNQTIYGSIVVRVPGMKGLEVDLSTGGGFSATCTTGSKPEYGETACEFGGLLSGGTYTIAPRGLGASLQVTLQQGDFVLVEFVYSVPPTPTPPGGAAWVGYVVSNTSGPPTGRDNSAIVVRVLGPPGIDVEIFSATGWHNLATTGTKPEHGPGACEFGNLRAGTYTIVPQGLGTSVEVTVDGQGMAVVEFAPR